jgi:hypothetical protein
MRVATVACSLAVAVAWPELSTPEKYKPLIEACESSAELSSCTAHMTGTCTTHEDGARSCSHHCDGKGFWKAVSTIKDKLGFHSEGHHHQKEGMPRLLGDCGSKADGEECTAPHEGMCVPSGKCPIFKGQMVCKAKDARPPSFVTKPCDGKQEGDACRFTILSGTCYKGKYDDYMACKTWPWTSKKEDTSKKADTADEKVLVV